MLVGSPFPRTFAFSLALIFALGCAGTVAAQSGRRAPKSSPAPATVPTPEPTPAAVVVSEQPKPALQIVVGIDRYDSFSSISLNTYNEVLRSCAQRLDEAPSVSVERVERSLSRGEASNRAKAEKNAYVVWLRVREDEMSNNTTGTPNNVYIEYFVFAPTTSKVVSSGSAYPRQRGGIIPSSRTSNGDREVIEAARAVANKILSALQMHIPSHTLSLVD
jgi:hypothetical protein